MILFALSCCLAYVVVCMLYINVTLLGRKSKILNLKSLLEYYLHQLVVVVLTLLDM